MKFDLAKILFSQKRLLYEKYGYHAYGLHRPINTNHKLYYNKSSHRPTNTSNNIYIYIYIVVFLQNS